MATRRGWERHPKLTGEQASITDGIAAALWLAALWYAAGLLSREQTVTQPADRLRDAIALGVFIPFALSICGILSGVACAALAGALAAVRFARVQCSSSGDIDEADRRNGHEAIARAVPTLACIAVAWPGLVRPLLQGDSLGYHLPNAAAWSVTHSFWTTGTTYWWYPGGSEMFAAGLFSVAGPASLGLAGFVVLLLLAHRLYAFGRKADVPPWCAGIVAGFVVSVPIIALQGHDLENDVWLSAWTLEIVWAAMYDRATLMRSAGVAALIKPYGFVYAAVALAAARTPWRTALLALVPFAVWVVRDALLWPSATLAPAQTAIPNVVQTTIAAHGLGGVMLLARAVAAQGAGTIVLALALAATLLFAREPVVRLIAAFGALFYYVVPLGFASSVPQLANGASLRYAIPALVVGIVGMVRPLGPFTWPAGIALAALAAFDVRSVLGIFWNDAATHGVVYALIPIALMALLPRRHIGAAATAIVAFGLVVYAARLAAARPVAYYDDWLGNGAQRSGLFAWLVRTQPSRIVGWEFPVGAISVVMPHAAVFNTGDSAPCAQARALHAVLVLHDVADAPLGLRHERIDRVRACGRALYRDRTALVVDGR